MKGALVEVTKALGTSIPNVVTFQFNPETLRHTWSQVESPSGGASASNPLALGGLPTETFSFELAIDVDDRIPVPPVTPSAPSTGIYKRLAALEMLLFPTESSDQLLGTQVSASGEARPTPNLQVPVVLFVWGAVRVLPVRVTSLTITEKIFDADLNPTHADAQVELRVITPGEMSGIQNELREAMIAAYGHSQIRREELAIANLGDAARDAIGILSNL